METLIKYLYRHASEYDLQDVGNVVRGHGVRSGQHPRLHGCRRYDYMEVIGTTPGKEEVEQRQEQLSRVESGTETEKMSGTNFPDKAE